MSNMQNDHYYETKKEAIEEAHSTYGMKHQCICKAKHGDGIFQSCDNQLLEGSICDSCTLNCLKGGQNG